MGMIFINFEKMNRWKILILGNSLIDYLIQLTWNISENKVDFKNFENISGKVKCLGSNLSINSLFLARFAKVHIFANNRFSTLNQTVRIRWYSVYYLFFVVFLAKNATNKSPKVNVYEMTCPPLESFLFANLSWTQNVR